MTKYLLVGVAFLSPVLFPYPLTLLLSFFASMVFVPTALLVGVTTDLLYYLPESSLWSIPQATVVGALLSLGALLVRTFVQARIITK